MDVDARAGGEGRKPSTSKALFSQTRMEMDGGPICMCVVWSCVCDEEKGMMKECGCWRCRERSILLSSLTTNNHHNRSKVGWQEAVFHGHVQATNNTNKSKQKQKPQHQQSHRLYFFSSSLNLLLFVACLHPFIISLSLPRSTYLFFPALSALFCFTTY